MSDECRTEVKRHETRAAKDYRLNYRLNKACDLEIDRLCADVCSPFSGQACEGTVIQCLTQKAENVTDQVSTCDLMRAMGALVFFFGQLLRRRFRLFVTSAGMQEGNFHNGENHGQ